MEYIHMAPYGWRHYDFLTNTYRSRMKIKELFENMPKEI